MKILLCHNHYQTAGGEDQVFEDEARLLAEQGHEVLRFTRHNDEIERIAHWRLPLMTVWNPATYRELRALLRRERPAIMHCTNTFPLISPAAYFAARDVGVPVVQSLHNFRLVCPRAVLCRDNQICEDCLKRLVPWPGVLHACYRGSRAASVAVALMLTVHAMARTWERCIDLFVALTPFSRDKMIEGGLPADRFVVKPNFVHPDPGPGTGDGNYALAVGRLVPEKGFATLLAAWEQLDARLPLKIVGDGRMSPAVREAAARSSQIEWLGRLPVEKVLELLGRARCLVMPSIWYEHCPKTIIEAFARGVPVICSRLGAMIDLVHPGESGLLFAPGDPTDLAATVQALLADPSGERRMRRGARAAYEARFTAETNYRRLMEIYARVLEIRSAAGPVEVERARQE